MKENKVKTILFDMDGTLTEPRKSIKMNMVSALSRLSKHAKVGIVTGSGFEYIVEQCSLLWDNIGSQIDFDNFILMPCNGTKVYKMEKSSFKLAYEADMKEKLGKEKYSQLIYKLIENQLRLKHTLYGKLMPLTGNFIDCRGSMINWCPIGRNASQEDRALWVSLDSKHNIRNSILDNYFRSPDYSEIEIKLGGSTSFDLFPSGWDKTYAYNHLEVKDCYFIGDRCTGQGNDKEIYEKTKTYGLGSYEVKSTEETIEKINLLIGELK